MTSQITTLDPVTPSLNLKTILAKQGYTCSLLTLAPGDETPRHDVNQIAERLLFVLPSIVAGTLGVISWRAALVLAGLGCTVLPFLLYRSTWSWWLMLYFLFLPQSLPANGGPIGESEED